MPGRYPEFVEVIVEVPKGSRNKYEFDRKSGRIKLNRVLWSSVHYPADYGYIPGTLAEDGDEVDILVVIEEPTFPGCLIDAKVVGILLMEDEKGVDNKVLGVAASDPFWGVIERLDDFPPHLLAEIKEFFVTYKRLESKEVKCYGWRGPEDARAYLAARVSERPVADDKEVPRKGG